MDLLPYTRSRFWSPARAFDSLWREFDRFLDTSLFGDREREFFGRDFVPAIDIHEEDDKITVRADLPGLKKDEIDLSIRDNVLTLKGERKQEHEDKGKDYHRIERRYGQFIRSIPLPDTVDADKVSADYRDGVLEIVAPKSSESKTKKIAVKAE